MTSLRRTLRDEPDRSTREVSPEDLSRLHALETEYRRRDDEPTVPRVDVAGEWAAVMEWWPE